MTLPSGTPLAEHSQFGYCDGLIANFIIPLEKALRAFASSSGGAACPGGYPGSTPGVDPRSQGVIPRRFKRKKNL